VLKFAIHILTITPERDKISKSTKVR